MQMSMATKLGIVSGFIKLTPFYNRFKMGAKRHTYARDWPGMPLLKSFNLGVSQLSQSQLSILVFPFVSVSQSIIGDIRGFVKGYCEMQHGCRRPDFHPHPYRMRLKIRGLSHGLKSVHRTLFAPVCGLVPPFRVQPVYQKEKHPQWAGVVKRLF